jgi:non-lysosomal glucosylceramidase
MKRLGWVLLLVLLTGCVGPAAPTGPLPTQVPQATTAPPLVHIPSAAWSRPLGLPFAEAGRSKTSYPTIDDGPFQGLPLGGLGAGTIGRTYRGDFARWHVDLGSHTYQPLPADQFSLYMEQQGRKQAHVLYAGKQDPDVLQAWNWDYPVGAGTYYALYPFAWYDYAHPDYPARLTVQQFSPIIPQNYQETSYPVAVFLWNVANPTTSPLTVTVMFTWQDMLSPGWSAALAGNTNRAQGEETPGGQMVGVVMSLGGTGPVDEEWKGTMALAALEQPGLQVTYRTRFVVNGDEADVWSDLTADGVLDNVEDATPSTRTEPIGAALAVGARLEPGQVISFPIALAWDLPLTEFDGGTQWYKKYTAYFGRDGQQAWKIAQEALREYDDWRAQIEAWQTAWGLYNVTYVTRGLWFRTPEAWDRNGNFRASMYMRPQAIWALEYAYRGPQ